MKKIIAITGAAALALTAGSAMAQVSNSQQSEPNPLAAIFGALFGDRTGSTTSIEAQWAAGQTPLANQRAQFESRIDTEIRTGGLTQATGARLKSDYYDLVQLEARYGADRRFTTAERTTLADRYGDLTQVLADRGYADNSTYTTNEVADGRAEFDARVDAALAARQITRAQARRLKTDYAAVANVEASYLRDGVISGSERADLDTRLDALDARLPGTAYATLTPRQRLDTIGRALANNRLSTNVRAQLQVEYEDLARLESAYARINESADEQAYLDRRLAELETRARVGLGANSF
jgi:hypothetical protein